MLDCTAPMDCNVPMHCMIGRYGLKYWRKRSSSWYPCQLSSCGVESANHILPTSTSTSFPFRSSFVHYILSRPVLCEFRRIWRSESSSFLFHHYYINTTYNNNNNTISLSLHNTYVISVSQISKSCLIIILLNIL